MAIKPVKFGPYFWGVLHLACLGGIDPEALRALVAMFPAILPCPSCGAHFEQVLQENPLPETTDPDLLFRWSVHVHNIVNARLEKPIVSYEAALAEWTRLPATQEPVAKPKFDPKLLVILVLLVIIGFLLMSRNKI